MKVKINKKIIWGLFLLLMVMLIVGGSCMRVLDHFELNMLDWRFKLRPKIPTSDKIVLIEISDDTINKLGQFPIRRDYHATLVEALKEAGAESVVFDIFFSEKRENDIDLEKAIVSAGNVYLPNVLFLNTMNIGRIPVADEFTATTLEQFTRPAKGVGHINIIPDVDGKTRRVPLLIKYTDNYYPYQSFQVILDHLGISLRDLIVKEGRFIKHPASDLTIPIDAQSMMVINYTGPWGKSYKHYSYVDILRSHFAERSGEQPLLDLSLLKDKICIIGLTAAGTHDMRPTPFEPLYPAVGIHAEVMNSVLQNNFIARAAKSHNILILIGLILIVVWASLKTRPIKAFFILIAGIIIFVVIGVLLFIFGNIWIDLFYPLNVLIVVYLGTTLYKYVMQWKKNILMENELEIAKKIQESFLPKKQPKISGLDTAAAMFTARHVGGDLYDFLEFDKENLGVMIGDVTGKGVPAALFMAMAVSGFKFFAKLDVKPEEALANLNVKLKRESSSNLFVTVYYSIFNQKEKTMSYGSAGHNPLLYLPKDGEPKFLDVDEGPPAGMIKRAKYSGNQIGYSEGDVFIFYTDGVTEARDNKGEMYMEKRLVELAKKNKTHSAKEILDAITKDVFEFEPIVRQHDDVTVVVVKTVSQDAESKGAD